MPNPDRTPPTSTTVRAAAEMPRGPARDSAVAEPVRIRRPTCAVCLRPVVRCVCATLPLVTTHTRVVIVQHPRERSHPFGTAALAAQSLTNSELVVAWRPEAALPIEPGAHAWLLYPGPRSIPVEAALQMGRPHTLVAVDGTWHTAPSLLRSHPVLGSLPQVRLAPSEPSRYRIRAEPAPDCLSTLESVVAALETIEPETTGLTALLAAFDEMVERQLALRAERTGNRPRRRERERRDRAVPRVLAEDFEQVVVVYGESAAPAWTLGADARAHRSARATRSPLQWVAVRPASGACFERVVHPPGDPPSAWHLRHLGLSTGELGSGVSAAELARDFSAFAGRDAVLFAWNRSTIDLALGLREVGGAPGCAIATALKAVVANVTRKNPGTLEKLVATLGLSAVPLPCRGRAAVRLAQAAAVAEWLHRRSARADGRRDCSSPPLAPRMAGPRCAPR
ncbi:MAG: DTW domain-containing protein [Polyangiaceae bacterium]|nr:DTW domain-containing protein [Polyangiaceae bacterium]